MRVRSSQPNQESSRRTQVSLTSFSFPFFLSKGYRFVQDLSASVLLSSLQYPIYSLLVLRRCRTGLNSFTEGQEMSDSLPFSIMNYLRNNFGTSLLLNSFIAYVGYKFIENVSKRIFRSVFPSKPIKQIREDLKAQKPSQVENPNSAILKEIAKTLAVQILTILAVSPFKMTYLRLLLSGLYGETRFEGVGDCLSQILTSSQGRAELFIMIKISFLVALARSMMDFRKLKREYKARRKSMKHGAFIMMMLGEFWDRQLMLVLCNPLSVMITKIGAGLNFEGFIETLSSGWFGGYWVRLGIEFLNFVSSLVYTSFFLSK